MIDKKWWMLLFSVYFLFLFFKLRFTENTDLFRFFPFRCNRQNTRNESHWTWYRVTIKRMNAIECKNFNCECGVCCHRNRVCVCANFTLNNDANTRSQTNTRQNETRANYERTSACCHSLTLTHTNKTHYKRFAWDFRRVLAVIVVVIINIILTLLSHAHSSMFVAFFTGYFVLCYCLWISLCVSMSKQ